MKSLKDLITEDAEFTSGDGNHFDFNDEISIKITRFADSVDDKVGPFTPPTATPSTSSLPISILKSSNSKSVCSEISIESRIEDLESSMNSLNTKLDKFNLASSPPAKVKASLVPSPSGKGTWD